MVTIASGGEHTGDQRIRDAFFIVEPTQKQLTEVANLLAAGELKTFIGAVVPLAEASSAYSGAVPNKRGSAKVVVVVNHQT